MLFFVIFVLVLLFVFFSIIYRNIYIVDIQYIKQKNTYYDVIYKYTYDISVLRVL